jgi:hypothetical protein
MVTRLLPRRALVSACAVIIPDNGRDNLAPRQVNPHDAPEEDASPCPGFGWQPMVIQISEVVVEYPRQEYSSQIGFWLKPCWMKTTIHCPAESDR